MDNSLSPIKTRPESLLTQSDVESLAGSDKGDNVINMAAFNTKHFSRNTRLQHEDIINVSKNKSPRLGEEEKVVTPKKSNDQSKVKKSHSKNNTSSCKDTAPKANQTSTPKPNKKKTTDGKPYKSAYLADSSLSSNETAAQRFSHLVGLIPDERDRSGSKDGNNSNQSGGAEPEASTSKKEHGVEVNPDWYQWQGAEYRRLQKKHAAKKKEDKETSLVSAMREKTKALEKMADAMQDKGGCAEGLNVDSADQLWANSLVPQMGRMTDEVRDQFMHTVFGMASKAIKGTLPPK